MKRIFERENKSREQLDSLFVYTVLATMLGARLGHVFFYDWPYYKNHLLEILLPIRERAGSTLFGIINGYEFTGFTGLASHGAAIGVIVGMYLFTRKHREFNVLYILDRIVIPISLGAFLVRLGNFFNSEINGKIIGEQAEKTFYHNLFRIREDGSQSKGGNLTTGAGLGKESAPNPSCNPVLEYATFAPLLKNAAPADGVANGA